MCSLQYKSNKKDGKRIDLKGESVYKQFEELDK